MNADTALDHLHTNDPARLLPPLSPEARAVSLDRAILEGPQRSRTAPRRTRGLRLVAALVWALFVGVGVAWAAGAISPLQVFEQSIQQQDVAPGSLWDQEVIPSTVRNVETVEIPSVGSVEYWTGRAAQGGWCGALQLPDGHWLGTGGDELDAGGVEPGCYPTREAINGTGKPVLVIDGFDYAEALLDARADGGAFWRINSGRITVPGAAAVRDLVTGRTVPVVNGFFVIALQDEDPMHPGFTMHLIALDRDDKIVADNCPACR